MHDCLLVVVYRIAFWDRDRVRIGICHSLVFVWILYLVMDDRRGTKVQCILACSLNLVLVFFCLVSRLGSGEWKWKLCMNCTEDWYREEQVMGLDWIGRYHDEPKRARPVEGGRAKDAKGERRGRRSRK